jgi:ABC-2 type transport system permease protein
VPFLWAFLPVFAILAAEKIAFNTMHFGNWLKHRLTGDAGPVAHIGPGSLAMDPFTHRTLGEFLSTPGLWLGLIVAAAFLFAAARLRRYREPI